MSPDAVPIVVPVTPSFGLQGRRALVTGGSKGLGFACCAALATAGAHVTLVARTAADVEPAVQAIRAAGGAVDGAVLDVTDVQRAGEWVQQLPAFHVLVNNAGTNRPGPFTATTPGDFDAVFAVNVRSCYFMTQAVARQMLAQGTRGSIINISSQMGHVGAAGRTVYCASKFAIEGLTRAAAAELAPHGIRVNSVAPTFIETAMTRRSLEDAAFRAWVLNKIKLGRIGQVEDVMGAIVYLASDASALMTASSLMLDGGWTGTC